MTTTKLHVFVVTLVVKPSADDPIRALRGLLKVALRRYGLRCIEAREVTSDSGESSPPPVYVACMTERTGVV